MDEPGAQSETAGGIEIAHMCGTHHHLLGFETKEIGRREIGFAILVHGGSVAGAPPFGKAGPIQVNAFGFSPNAAFLNDGAAPIYHGSERVEEQRLRHDRRSRESPSRKTCYHNTSTQTF